MEICIIERIVAGSAQLFLPSSKLAGSHSYYDLLFGNKVAALSRERARTKKLVLGMHDSEEFQIKNISHAERSIKLPPANLYAESASRFV